MLSMFLSREDLKHLTGYSLKNKQIEQLRKMHVAFRINACGEAVVTRLAVEGQPELKKLNTGWTPAVLHNQVKLK